MKITPKTGPTYVSPGLGKPSAASSAKAAAIAAFNQATSPHAPPPSVTLSTQRQSASVESNNMGSSPTDSLGINPSIPRQEREAAETVDPAPIPSETPESPSLAAQHAALARERKAARARYQRAQQELASERARIAAQEQALKTREAEYSTKYISRDQLQQEALAAIKDGRMSYDEIVNSVMNQPTPENQALLNEFRSVKAELEAIKASQDSYKQEQERASQDAYKQAVQQIRMDVQQVVRNNPDFEAVAKTGSVNEVVKLIEYTYNNGLNRDFPKGSIIPVEVAAQMIEDDLVTELSKASSQISKVQKRLQSNASAGQKTQTQAQAQTQQLRTLTNNVSTSKPLSARDRAILAARGEL